MNTEEIIQAIKVRWIKEFGNLNDEVFAASGYFVTGFVADVLKENKATT
jgi:hypothetical protein